MKMADSLKYLLALIVLGFDGGLSFKSSHVSYVRRNAQFLSPLRVASSTWATSNDGLGAHCIEMNVHSLFLYYSQYSYQHIASSARRTSTVDSSTFDKIQQNSKAPLVDSTLLRFLSAQKNGSIAPPNGSRGHLSTDLSPATISEEESCVELEVSTPDHKFAIDAEIDQNTHPAVGITQSEKMSQSQSWLSQYNAQKVALKLQALGVDESTALNTGKIVQDYVLARITRRRIRKFLQERDASWETGKPLPFDRSGIKESISPAATYNYNLDSVVSVMTEYGLTGNDIAAVLAHTPSVSMMKSRPNKIESETVKIDAERRGFTLVEALDSAFVELLGDTLKLRRYDARKVSIELL